MSLDITHDKKYRKRKKKVLKKIIFNLKLKNQKKIYIFTPKQKNLKKKLYVKEINFRVFANEKKTNF